MNLEGRAVFLILILISFQCGEVIDSDVCDWWVGDLNKYVMKQGDVPGLYGPCCITRAINTVVFILKEDGHPLLMYDSTTAVRCFPTVPLYYLFCFQWRPVNDLPP